MHRYHTRQKPQAKAISNENMKKTNRIALYTGLAIFILMTTSGLLQTL